jgi:allantoin racemase
MKIWYQSASSYRYEAAFEFYGKTLEEQCQRAARPDTEIYVTGLPVMMREIDRFKSVTYFHKVQMLNNMLKAEKEGFDAFAIGCTSDTGLEEGREMLSIPVVGISQTGYYLAGMLGELFAIVTISPYFCEKYRQQVVRYGLENKHLRGNYYFPATEEEVALALKNPEPVMEEFKVVARKAIADGASVIVPNPAFLATAAYRTGLTSLDNVLVLDTISAVVKAAEMFADLKKLGIEVSRKLGVYGHPGKELLQKTFEKYRPVFKIES